MTSWKLIFDACALTGINDRVVVSAPTVLFFYTCTLPLCLLQKGYTADLFAEIVRSSQDCNMDGKMKKKRAAPVQKTKSPKKPKRAPKKGDENKIKRPLSAYLYFTKEFRLERAAKGLDNSRVNEVAKLAGERWKSMNDVDKAPFNKQASADKLRYQQETGKNVVAKDSDKPKRNPTAYFIFLAAFRKEKAGETLPEGQKIPTLAGERWRAMTDKDKEPYLKEEAKEKGKYEELMKEYNKKVKDVPKPEKKAPPKPKKKPEPVVYDDEDEDDEDEEEDDDDEEEDDDDDDDE